MKKQAKTQPVKLTDTLIHFIKKHQILIVLSLLFYIIYSNYAFLELMDL